MDDPTATALPTRPPIAAGGNFDLAALFADGPIANAFRGDDLLTILPML
jgi:hypothetical protein